ncbi:MAG: MarR family transcriptional regulator [Dehalogenimonas sp.]
MDYLISKGVYGTYIKLMTVRAMLYQMRSKELQTIGITPENAAVLLMVKNSNNSATPAEIARSFHRAPHSVSQILRRMEKKGLLKLSKDLAKKNMIRVSLSEEGERLHAQALENERVLQHLFSQYSEQEYAQLNTVIDALLSREAHTLSDCSAIIKGNGHTFHKT